MKRHHTGPIPPNGQRNEDKALALFAAGKTVAEVAAELGLARGTARDYRTRAARRSAAVKPARSQKYMAYAPRCPVCGLRMFSGSCEECLPTSAVAYMRSGEPAASMVVW